MMRPGLLALLLLVPACPGTTDPPSDPLDLGPDSNLQFHDSAPPEAGADLTAVDGPVFDAPLPNACTAKTSDGIALNPGCDPDVKANGVTAVDIVTLGGKATWFVLSGKKWWNLDVASGTFTTGGKEIATFLKSLAPACSARTSDGIALNPGCDLDVQVNGLAAVGNLQTSSGTSWILTSGTKWWSYDAAQAAFTTGGKDFGALMRTLAPACTAKTGDGIALNPGCDVDVTAKGVTAIDIVTLGGQTAWIAMTGKKWWRFDVKTTTFTSGGKTIATFLTGLQPACTAKTGDGIALNPGCDPDVQVNGLAALGSMTLSGKTSWYMSSGKKWWSYDLTQAAFTAGGKDVAALFRTLKP